MGAVSDIKKVNISVRMLVEFILRAGDIDNRGSHAIDTGSMQEGSRLHRKLQKAMGSEYSSEVSLKHETVVEYEGETFILCIEGRADGVFSEPAEEDGESIVYIDEIKTTFADVMKLEEPYSVHRSQAMCYAYIYAVQNDLQRIGVRMTYCNQDTEEIKRLYEVFSFDNLAEWFEALTKEYAKWAARQQKWVRVRDESIKTVEFPFPYREGQRDLVASVYRTIARDKKLFIEAPTGVGKTMSTVFPTVRAMGEGLVEKIFYGTAKTIARTVAEEAFSILGDKGMKLKCVTITAKEKLCILEEPECNPVACERAKGHYDRVNDAVYDMLTHEEQINRQLIEKYAEKHRVCPFEMCLDVTTWADAVICDYNYLFDPSVHLKRFFDAEGTKHNYCLLLDEAHNLVERAREMYSAVLVKERFLEAKAAFKNNKSLKTGVKMSGALESVNRALLALKRECDDFEIWEDADAVYKTLMHFAGVFEDISRELSREENEAVIDLYFDARHFMSMYDMMDDDYTIYTDYAGRDFRLVLECMDPSKNLLKYLRQSRASVFFSATLLPVTYYKEQLGGSGEDYAVYAPSPFDTNKRLLMVAGDVSTKYTRRNEDEYNRITNYLCEFTKAKKGNYMVFFPSYQLMEAVAGLAEGKIEGLRVQSQSMTEAEKEEFLNSFENITGVSNVGFCVMGGIFGEGIDLKSDRLIGVAVVGTGLPMVCNERELFRGYFDNRNSHGFEYAYLYNGMNKVLQAAGRVIRTTEDRGVILLLDERFLNRQYMELFPREWSDYKRVNADNVGRHLKEFWDRQP